jgi:hypothetical protein
LPLPTKAAACMQGVSGIPAPEDDGEDIRHFAPYLDYWPSAITARIAQYGLCAPVLGVVGAFPPVAPVLRSYTTSRARIRPSVLRSILVLV